MATARTRSSPRCQADLGDQVATRGAVLTRDGDAQRVVDLGQRPGEDRVDDDALDLDDLAHIVFRDIALSHVTPEEAIAREDPRPAAHGGRAIGV
jgi:hypothetical protein